MSDKNNKKILQPDSDQLFEFFNTSLEMLCVAGLDGYFKALNPSIIKLFGYSEEELLNTPYIELIHPDDRKATEKEIAKLVSGVDTITFENRCRCKDGSYRWLHWSCPAPGKYKDVLFASARDITEKKKLEESLGYQQGRFGSLVANIPGVVYRCACDSNWTMEHISDYIQELTGYPASDFIDNKVRSYASIIHSDDVSMVEHVVLDAVEQHDSFVIEYRVCHKNGEVRHVFEKGRAVYDKDGRIDWLDGVILDVTKRKRIEENLSLMAKFPDENPNAVLRISDAGIVLYHNKAAVPFMVAIGSKIGQKLPKKWALQVNIVLDTKSTKRFETEIKGRTFLCVLVPIEDASERKFVYMYAQDISELKIANRDLVENEKLLRIMVKDYQQSQQELIDTQLQLMQSEKLKVVGRMASGVAHEVKNPLAIILQGTEYLSKKVATDNKDVALTLKDIEEAVERANVVIKGLLDFSSISKLDLKPADINDIVQEALKFVNYEIEKKNIEVTLELDNKIDKIKLDKDKMKQVFVNIFINAIQAMEKEGHLQLKSYRKKVGNEDLGVGRRREDPLRLGEAVVVVEVVDNGEGIPEEILDKIFDPFFTTKHGKEGTGLGLSVIENIIALHHGTIIVTNNAGGGSKVSVVLKE